jgi:hypothetical protein
VQIFFIVLFEEKLNKLLDQLNISRISGIRPNRISGRISGSSILKRPDFPAGYPAGRISGASLLLTQVLRAGYCQDKGSAQLFLASELQHSLISVSGVTLESVKEK